MHHRADAALRIDEAGERFEFPAEPVNVTIVLSGLGAGGAEHVAQMIANHWAGRGWAVSVVSLDPPDAPSYYTFDPRVSVHRLGLPPRPCSKLDAARLILGRIGALRRTMWSISPDVVVSFLTRQNILTLLATRGMGIPVVVSERSNPELQNPGRFWRRLRTMLYPRAFALVTMTEGACAYFRPAVRARTWIIPNPVELPAHWRNRREARSLVAVGRLEEVKGFDLLLEAFARIAATFPDWNLLIWGEGPERGRLETLRSSLGLDHRVVFAGVTDEPGAWIETADIFVLSSHYEGWPNALAEAMAGGLPAVAFDCPWGPGDMIRHGADGLLVNREDVPALGEALAGLMRDPLLRRKLGQAAQRSARRLQAQNIMPRWDRLIDSAMRV